MSVDKNAYFSRLIFFANSIHPYIQLIFDECNNNFIPSVLVSKYGSVFCTLYFVFSVLNLISLALDDFCFSFGRLLCLSDSTHHRLSQMIYLNTLICHCTLSIIFNTLDKSPKPKMRYSLQC